MAVTAAVTVAIVLVVGAKVFLHRTFENMCRNESVAEYVSPDGMKKLVVFQRSCGATTGFSTQASLLAPDAGLPSEAGDVFIGDTDHGDAPSGTGGGPELRARWETSNQLVLQHHVKARVFKAERYLKDTNIRYETFK